MSPRTCFEKEGKGNSEMAYSPFAAAFFYICMKYKNLINVLPHHLDILSIFPIKFPVYDVK